jgi:putative ATP-binding cassette transporter
MTLGSLVLHARPLLVAAIASGVVSGLSSAGLIAVVEPATAPGGAGWTLIALFAGLVLISVASKALSQLLLSRLGQATIAQLRRELSRRIVAAPLRRLQELGTHRLLAALHEDTGVITQAFVLVPLVCVEAATVLGCLAYLGWISWPALALVGAGIALGTGIFLVFDRRAARELVLARATNDALFRHFRGLTNGVKELQLSGERARSFLGEVLGGSIAEYERRSNAGLGHYTWAMGFSTLIFYGALGVTIFGLPALGQSDSAVRGATLALLFLAPSFAHLVELVPSVQRASIALDNVASLGLGLEGEPRERPRLVAGSAAPSPRRWRSIELRAVTHRYSRENEAGSFQLGPLDLRFEPGEVCFLVGGNGSGKTTFALLLLGLYSPESGEIYLDGVKVDETNRERYRELFTAIFADYHLFDELPAHADASLEARARALLSRLELQRRVTIEQQRWVTSGLSQGQGKRLALINALLEDRPFYVFDEWAADQDPVFRRIFYTELLPDLRARGKTVLVISHDDQYFALADRCIKLDFGRIQSPPASERTASAHLLADA